MKGQGWDWPWSTELSNSMEAISGVTANLVREPPSRSISLRLCQMKEPEEKIARSMPRGGSETILLVDDEDMIRDLCSRILAKSGYSVITASNGKEALELYIARERRISLVILDLIMPQMGGKQCLDDLLSLDPAVKVLIASGYSSNDATQEALASGARGFVNKPYDMRQVLGVVREVLDAE